MRLGCHVNKYTAKDMPTQIVDTIHKLSEIIEIGALSMFLTSPRRMTIYHTTDELDAIKKILNMSKITMILHSSYVVIPWSGNRKVLSHIYSELIKCDKYKFDGTVIHLPDKPLDEITEILELLSYEPETKAKIYFETPPLIRARYATPKQLCELYTVMKKFNPTRFAICIDTAHIWISGVDIRSYENASSYLTALVNGGIDPSDIMFHLNDSIREQHHGPDEHCKLMTGKIWGTYTVVTYQKSGLAAFIDFANRYNSVVILERNKYDDIIDDCILLSKLSP